MSLASPTSSPPDDGGEPLLGEVMMGGRSQIGSPALHELRERFTREFGCLPDRHRALRSPAMYQVTTSVELERLRLEVSEGLTERETGA